MNGSAFIASTAWPLTYKMDHTNFPAEPIARLEALPVTDIAWFAPGKHPVQGIIRHSATTENAIAGGGDATTKALAIADTRTSIAVDTAEAATGNTLQESSRKTWHALSAAARKTTHALKPAPKPVAPNRAPQ